MIRSGVDVTKFVIPIAVDRDEKVPREEGAHPKQIEDEVDSIEAVPWWGFAGIFRQQEIYKEGRRKKKKKAFHNHPYEHNYFAIFVGFTL